MESICAAELLIIVACSAALCFCTVHSTPAHHSPVSVTHHNFDVTGNDFMNTQMNKLCLLARLNASIHFFYKDKTHLPVFVPDNAINKHSYCDFNFTSLLQLDFDGLSFSLVFQRDSMERSETAPVYCNKCDGGHWQLLWLKLKTTNIQEVVANVPQTEIVAEAHATDLSEVAGGFISHISLQRGYRCLDKVLSADLKVVEAFNKVTGQHTMEDWKISLHIYSIEVQPFLVTNAIVKDPILCRDVTLSVVLIVTIPIIYFVIFIVIYRLKDEGKLREWRKRFLPKNKKSKKPMSDSPSREDSPTVKMEPISVTCSSPDESTVRLL